LRKKVNPEKLLMKNKKQQILFIGQYPENVSPCQRFRFELYKELLEENGFNVTPKAFLNRSEYDIIHQSGFLFAKFSAVIKGYFRRITLLYGIKKYNFIFLQREAAPLGPPVFEWLYCKVYKIKVIYDFDDAIWVPHTSDNNSIVLKLKNVSKVKKICTWAHKVSCGNQFLCNYARKYNNNVVYNPTCVDADSVHNILANHDVKRITIGWTGSFSTLIYLAMLEPVLERLQQKYDFDIKIICNQSPSLRLRNVQYVKWNAQNEVPELASCQIGLMPLTNDEWSEGKCGFKLIQYLSLGIPSVASPVGVNKIIIEEGVNGFLCITDDDWYNAIEKLINDAEVRIKMGIEGRKKIINQYSLHSNTENFLNLFR
jgi:glycosyltransferase involved in cell wall biosynthesis